MSRHRMAVVALATVMISTAWLAIPVAGQSDRTDRQAEAALQAAINKEVVDGNLEAAIAQYKQVLARYAGNRAVAAKALTRIGQAYEKLGSTEARKAYERVVRDYGDQAEPLAEALARIGVLGSQSTGDAVRAGGVITHQVWSTEGGKEFYGRVSPDGRYLPYVDWGKDANLYLHDLATGSDRPLTDQADAGKNMYPEEYSFSRDGKQLVYNWDTGIHYELRLMSLQGSGVPRNRVLMDNPDVRWIVPHDWTPDGRSIIVSLQRKDRTAQIGTVSVADGSLHVLKSVDWRLPQMFLSPDGKYVAYDTPAIDASQQRDIFSLALDATREVPVVSHPANDRLVGWSPDGKYLLFTSDRGGSDGLWAVAMSDGKPQSNPELITKDIGQVFTMGITGSGALYFWRVTKTIPNTMVQVASFDFSAGRFTSNPVTIVPAGSRFPAWSPDGKYLAYQFTRENYNDWTLVIRSVDSSESRELHQRMTLSAPARWSPDGRFLLAGGTDFKGRVGVHVVDVQTGEVSPVAITEEDTADPFLYSQADWSVDGKSVYYTKRHDAADTTVSYVVRDLASGNERELIRRRGLGDINRSPDGRYISTTAPGESANSRVVLLIPTTGGEPRELLRVNAPDRFSAQMWAPDSQSLFLSRITNGQRQVVRVSLTGEVRTVDIDADKYKLLVPPNAWAVANPDGRRIAFMAVADPASLSTPYKSQISVMENFLPNTSANK